MRSRWLQIGVMLLLVGAVCAADTDDDGDDDDADDSARDSLAAQKREQWASTIQELDPENNFQLLDADRDGKVTVLEVLQHVQLTEKDVGVLEQADIVVERHRLSDRNHDGWLTVEESVAYFHDRSVRERATSVIQHRQLLKELKVHDLNADQCLNRSEVVRMFHTGALRAADNCHDSFKRLDINEDKLLSKQELLQSYDLPLSPLQLGLEFQKTKAVHPGIFFPPTFLIQADIESSWPKFDMNGDGKWDFREYAWWRWPSEEVCERLNQVMAWLDQDKDGFVTWTELTNRYGGAAPEPSLHFTSLDSDKDGKVARRELWAIMRQEGMGDKNCMYSEAGYDHAATTFLKKVDQDEDGLFCANDLVKVPPHMLKTLELHFDAMEL